jgi:putative transposase
LEFRPVGQPNFGGHIERLLGTVLKRVHSLPGTTFSNIKERDTYDSDKHASMTFSEFEKWLVTYIAKVYHKKKHSALGMSPEQKWEKGIFGDLTTEGVGYLPKPSNAETILIDFLPMFSRTIQKNGVNFDGLNYYDHVLRVWINSINPETKKKQLFIFRRDPRDISYIWFFEPKLLTYYRLPLANQAIPPMNLWEFKAAKEKLKEKGGATSDHELITALEDLHKQTRESVKKSKKARRDVQKNKVHEKSRVISEISQVRPALENEGDDDFWNDDVVAFD